MGFQGGEGLITHRVVIISGLCFFIKKVKIIQVLNYDVDTTGQHSIDDNIF